MLYSCYQFLLTLSSCLTVIVVAVPSLASAATLQLSWNDNSQDEDGFHVERKQGTGGTFSLIATTAANATSYSDSNLASSTTYCYRVNAFNGAGSSAYTNETCATTPASTTAPPPSTTPQPAGSGTVAAVLLGQTGEDIAGKESETPDGIKDVHIRLSGVQSAVTGVTITDADDGIWQTPFNGANWIVAIRPQSDPSIVDLFFDFWKPTSFYTVALSFANGSTQTVQVSGSSSPSPSTTPSASVPSVLVATLLGQTGEDIAGKESETPDGVKDVHIRLSGVQSAIAGVTITDADDGIWQTPFNGANWIVAIRPQSDPSIVDLFFDFWKPTSFYTVTVMFTNGSTQTVQATSSSTASALAALLLGQTGEDIVGKTALGADGVKDVHIQLSGVASPVTRVRITGAEDGIWETPFNGQNWIVAIRPQSDPSIVDLFFDFWKPASSYTVALVFANGSTQTVQANAVVATAASLSKTSVTMLSNSSNTTGSQATVAANAAAQIGVFRPDTGGWLLDANANGQDDGCSVDICIHSFGQAGDIPVTRKITNLNEPLIGIYRQGVWMFDSNGNDVFDGCSVDECDNFGMAGDLPVTGDWSGSGTEAIGVFRPGTGNWLLDANGNGQWDGCGVDKCFGPFGGTGELPVTGDWNNAGQAAIGVFQPSTGNWFLDMNGNGQWDGCKVDKCFGPFGTEGDLPVVADWTGTGQVAIGVFRSGSGDWLLDLNGNGKFDGCEVDACLGPLGQPGGLPIVGSW